MLALEFIRKNPELVRESALNKGERVEAVDEVLRLDSEWRALQTRFEEARSRQNELSKQFAARKDQGLVDELRALSAAVKQLAADASDRRALLDEALAVVPNLHDRSVPVAPDESGNVVVREEGTRREFEFKPRPHHALGESLGILDLERAARVSGARFAFLRGAGSALNRALVQFMLDLHTREHDYSEITPPFLVNSASMFGTANLPRFAADAFKVEDYDLWLIPTAEVPVTNYHREEILEGAQLPIRYVGYSPCFRSEAGSAGRDTRGYIRQHQFEKVELVKLTAPEASMDEFEKLTRDAEEVLRRLGLAYRVKLMCTGDMGFAQYKKYDLEAWAPGIEQWLEVSSCSLFGDFQARRANLRYRPGPGEPPRFVHTINGSALALLRTWTAIVETYQTVEGTVMVPEVLRPYMGGREEIGPA